MDRCHIMHNHELLAWQVQFSSVLSFRDFAHEAFVQVQALRSKIETKSTSLMGNLDAAAASLLGSSAWLSQPLMSPSAGRKIAANLMSTQDDVAWLTNHLHRLLLAHASILEASTSSPSVSVSLLGNATQPGALVEIPALGLAAAQPLTGSRGSDQQLLARTAQGDVCLQNMHVWSSLIARLASQPTCALSPDGSDSGLHTSLAEGYMAGLGYPRVLRGVQYRILHTAATRSLVWAVNARGHVLASLLPRLTRGATTPQMDPVRASELSDDRAIKVVATHTHCIAMGKDGSLHAAACNGLFRPGMQNSLPIWQPHFHQMQAADLVSTAPVSARDVAACTLTGIDSASACDDNDLAVVCALPSAYSPHSGLGVYISAYTPPAPGSNRGIKPPQSDTVARSAAAPPLIPSRGRARTSAMSALGVDGGSPPPSLPSSAPQTSSPLREAATRVRSSAEGDAAGAPSVQAPTSAPHAASGPWLMQFAAVVVSEQHSTSHSAKEALGAEQDDLHTAWFTHMWMCASSGCLVLCDNVHNLWLVTPQHLREAAAESILIASSERQKAAAAVTRSRTNSNSTATSEVSAGVATARIALPARLLGRPTPPWGPPPSPLRELLPAAATWPAYNSVAVLGDTVAASSACGCAFVWGAADDWQPHTVANGPAASQGATLPVQQVSLLPTQPPAVLVHHHRFALHDALFGQVCMAPYVAKTATMRISTSGHPSPSLSSVDTPRQRLRAFRGSPPEFGLDSPLSSPSGSPALSPQLSAPRLKTWDDVIMALQHVNKALRASPPPKQGSKASNQVIGLVRAARALLKDGIPLSSKLRGSTWALILTLYSYVPWLWRPFSRSRARSRAGTGSGEELLAPASTKSSSDPASAAVAAAASMLATDVQCAPHEIDEERFAQLLRQAEAQTSDPHSNVSTRSISSQQRSTSLSARVSDQSLLAAAASSELNMSRTSLCSADEASSLLLEVDTSSAKHQNAALQQAAATYSTMLMIERDVCRTMSGSGIFDDASCPLHADLRAVLLAFAVWDPVTAYPQGLSYLASVCCLLQQERSASLRMLAVLTRQPCVLSLLRADVQVLHWHCTVFEHALARAMPDLAAHLQAENFEVQFALLPWFSTLFLRCLPPPLALPGIDMFVLGGTRALYCVALALFRLLRPALMHASFDLLTRILTVNAMQIAHVVAGTRPPRTRWDSEPEASIPNALAEPAMLTSASTLAEASDPDSHVLIPHPMSDVEAAWAAVKPSALSKAAHAEHLASYIKHAIQVVDAGSDPASVLTAHSGAAGSAAGIDSSTLAAESSVTSMWSLMYGGSGKSAPTSAAASPVK